MSAFANHVICSDCWKKRHPTARMPIRMLDDTEAKRKCCFCSERTETADGVFIREKSAEIVCKGDCQKKEAASGR